MSRRESRTVLVTDVVEAIRSLIRLNLIARTNVTSDVTTGDTVVNVENSFQYKPGDEIVLIDHTYNVPGGAHEGRMELAQIKEVNNTTAITLQTGTIDNWAVSDNTFIQKTIAHSPLYTEQVYYGDREIISTDEIAVTIEPESMSNEWIYIQGGLSQDFRVKIMVYGKNTETELGSKIVDMYADAICRLLNQNLHIDVNHYDAPITDDASDTDTIIYVEDTTDNQENFVLSSTLQSPDFQYAYSVQDNQGWSGHFAIENLTVAGGKIAIELDRALGIDLSTDEYAIFTRLYRYFYDSRVDGISYGHVRRGSAIVRAAEISWFGKEVHEQYFPQRLQAIQPFIKK